MHKNVRYNARVLSLNQEILLIRPKLSLANDGNYREMRYFSPWKGERIVEDFYLSRSVQKLTGQRKCRIGDALIRSLMSTFFLGSKICARNYLFLSDVSCLG